MKSCFDLWSKKIVEEMKYIWEKLAAELKAAFIDNIVPWSLAR